MLHLTAIMPRLLLIIFVLLHSFCSNAPSVKPAKHGVEKQDVISPVSNADYIADKKKVSDMRDSLQKEYLNATLTNKENILSACGQYLTTSIADQLIPDWYGTPWDFNGTTREPGTGAIACGYFITTLLQDAGITIERIKLAQLPSEEIIKKLANKSSIRRFSLRPVEEVEAVIKIQGPGLYIAGLDNHTGFLLYDGIKVYFIHSNYINRKGVMKEPAAESAPFYHSKYRVTGKISSNRELLKNWLKV